MICLRFFIQILIYFDFLRVHPAAATAVINKLIIYSGGIIIYDGEGSGNGVTPGQRRGLGIDSASGGFVSDLRYLPAFSVDLGEGGGVLITGHG